MDYISINFQQNNARYNVVFGCCLVTGLSCLSQHYKHVKGHRHLNQVCANCAHFWPQKPGKRLVPIRCFQFGLHKMHSVFACMSIPPVVNNRNISFSRIWNVYDWNNKAIIQGMVKPNISHQEDNLQTNCSVIFISISLYIVISLQEKQ